MNGKPNCDHQKLAITKFLHILRYIVYRVTRVIYNLFGRLMCLNFLNMNSLAYIIN